MDHELVIKNGLVILEDGEITTDVAVDNGKITAIGDNLSAQKIIDATGLIVSPGMVDAHVHITPMGGVAIGINGKAILLGPRLVPRGA